MTLLQIKYALVCARCNSLTKAAEMLYLSPSNVSKTLKALEEELQYAIFERKRSGMVPTEKGRQFLSYAASILEDYEKITQIGAGRQTASLSVCCNQVAACADAFVKYCVQHQTESAATFKLLRGSFGFCLEQLRRFKCQIGVQAFMPDYADVHLAEARRYGMRTRHIGNTYAALMLRKDHPLLQEGRMPDLQKLRQYPYIDYSYNDYDYQDETLTPYQVGSEDWPVNPEKIITVNSMSQKLELVRLTDGFTFGQYRMETPAAQDGIFYIPNVKRIFQIYCVYPEKEPLNDNAKRFLRLLREELASREAGGIN